MNSVVVSARSTSAAVHTAVRQIVSAELQGASNSVTAYRVTAAHCRPGTGPRRERVREARRVMAFLLKQTSERNV